MRRLDSALVTNRRFKIKGKVSGYNDKFFLKLNPHNRDNNDSLNNVRIPIENSNMNLSLELNRFSEYKLSGCKSCLIVQKFDSLNRVREDSSLAHEIIRQDTLIPDFIKRKIEIQDSIIELNDVKNWLHYYRTHINNNESMYILYKLFYHLELREIKRFSSKLNAQQSRSFYGTKLLKSIQDVENEERNDRLNTLKLLNSLAYNFIATDLINQQIILKDVYKRGITILDFWASWCVPCRKSHPKFKEILNRYNNENLNVIGISIDHNSADWEKAILKDSLTWPNILINKEDNTAIIPKKYNVKYYPTKILIDAKGIIIGIYTGDNFKTLEKN